MLINTQSRYLKQTDTPRDGCTQFDSGTLAKCYNLGMISPLDYKFVKSDPDEGFSESHNRQVIEDSIKETDKIQKKKRKEYDETVDERIDAVARFLQRAKMGVGESDVKSYFGKKMLEYLKGDKSNVITRQYEKKN